MGVVENNYSTNKAALPDEDPTQPIAGQLWDCSPDIDVSFIKKRKSEA